MVFAVRNGKDSLRSCLGVPQVDLYAFKFRFGKILGQVLFGPSPAVKKGLARDARKVLPGMQEKSCQGCLWPMFAGGVERNARSARPSAPCGRFASQLWAWPGGLFRSTVRSLRSSEDYENRFPKRSVPWVVRGSFGSSGTSGVAQSDPGCIWNLWVCTGNGAHGRSVAVGWHPSQDGHLGTPGRERAMANRGDPCRYAQLHRARQ